MSALERLPSCPVDLSHQNLTPSALPRLALVAILFAIDGNDGTVDGASETHAEVDADSVIHDIVNCLGIVGKVKVGEEAK